VKRLKESDLVVTQPSNLFGDFSIQVLFKIQTNNIHKKEINQQDSTFIFTFGNLISKKLNWKKINGGKEKGIYVKRKRKNK
jgi:hypothetical protein